MGSIISYVFDKFKDFFKGIFNIDKYITPFKRIFYDINIYLLIPIITKLILPFFISNLSLTETVLLKAFVGILSFMLTNLLDTAKAVDCNNDNTNIVNFIFRILNDSIIQYGFASLLPFVADLIPVVDEFVIALEEIPIIGLFVSLILWFIGYIVGLLLIQFTEGDSDDICSGSISFIKIFLSILALGIVFGSELIGTIL